MASKNRLVLANLFLAFHWPPVLAVDIGASSQTIASGDDFKTLDPCAQICVTAPPNCFGGIDSALGCAFGCGSAQNGCYCRTDHQSAAKSYLSSCISVRCTVGNSDIDLKQATDAYNNYCTNLGFVVTSTTAESTALTSATSSPSPQGSPGTTAPPTKASSSPGSGTSTSTSSSVTKASTGSKLLGGVAWDLVFLFLSSSAVVLSIGTIL